jgi:hypothetical protein
MNYIKKDGKEYIIIGEFKDDNSSDIKNKKYIMPSENESYSIKKDFLERLMYISDILTNNNKYYYDGDKNSRCLLCNQEISNRKYMSNKYIWNEHLEHYIHKHNFKPDESFIQHIFFVKINSKIKLPARLVKDKNVSYVKINKNQLLILDALMEHGGYTKKYSDLKNLDVYRYSEHSGLLDFELNKLDKILVSGNTSRVDKGDEEIFLPKNIPEMFEYEYIFHTHPPTPKPGGRVNDNILYELPSFGDILHFIDHFNGGKVCGSLIITAEGLYNIKPKNNNVNDIKVDEDKFHIEYNSIFKKIQKNAINKFGKIFSTNKFYSEIAQDVDNIDNINSITNKFDIQIDYYARVKDKHNNWIINDLYLPIYKK